MLCCKAESLSFFLFFKARFPYVCLAVQELPRQFLKGAESGFVFVSAFLGPRDI